MKKTLIFGGVAGAVALSFCAYKGIKLVKDVISTLEIENGPNLDNALASLVAGSKENETPEDK